MPVAMGACSAATMGIGNSPRPMAMGRDGGHGHGPQGGGPQSGQGRQGGGYQGGHGPQGGGYQGGGYQGYQGQGPQGPPPRRGRKGHRGCLAFLAFIVILAVALAVTCPGEDRHKEAVATEVNKAVSEISGMQDGFIGILGDMLTSSVASLAVDKMLTVKDCFVYSVGKVKLGGKEKVVSFGILGHVFSVSGATIRECVRENLPGGMSGAKDIDEDEDDDGAGEGMD